MDFKLPPVKVELPSKGLLYSETSPLSSGEVEIEYMTAKHQDILTNTGYIADGSYTERLLKSLIVNKSINIDDLLLGDKNALLIGARIIGIDNNYTLKIEDELINIDLSSLQDKVLDETLLEVKGKNEFKYKLPKCGVNITFKFITNGDEKKINEEIEALAKLKQSAEVTTRLRYVITSVEDKRDKGIINSFIENMPYPDVNHLLNYINKVQPGVDFSFDYKGENYPIPMTSEFFWPKASE